MLRERKRDGLKSTITFDHYTITFDELHVLETLSISDIEKTEELMYDSDIVDYMIEAVSKTVVRKFIVFFTKTSERVFIDCNDINNCHYIKPDDNGDIILNLASGLAFERRYSIDYDKEKEEMSSLYVDNNENEPEFIKKEVFIIMNDRILMYHLPFMGKVVEYMLNDDASSDQIHICVDYARIKGSILQQTYEGLSLDDKPLPVKSANECELIAELDHVAYDYMNQVVVKGSDGAEIYIDTYGQNASFVNDPDTRNSYYIKLNDIVSREIKDFKVGDSFDHNRFIYQTAN
jgi:hypothetical protein